MRPRENVHFEIMAQRGNAWTIVGISKQEKQAISIAKAKKISGGYGSVKVVREKYDAESGTFRTQEVYSEGRERKKSKYDDGEAPVACWRPSDFYSYEGRRTIGRLLRDELGRWEITATELIHSPEYVERLEDTGTAIQRSVQKVAIAESQESGSNVQERVKQIYELIDLAKDKLTTDWKSGKVPTLSAGGFGDLVASLDNDPARAYQMNCALVGYLKDCKTIREKIARVLALTDSEQPDWILEVVDTFVGELLSGVNMVQKLIGQQRGLGSALCAIADLSQGRLDKDRVELSELGHAGRTSPDARETEGGNGESSSAEDLMTGEDTWALNDLIAQGKLPNCASELEKRLGQQADGTRRLTDGNLLEEFRALTALLGRLTDGDGQVVGGDDMMEVLESRCGRYLNSDTIGAYLAEAETPADQVTRLLEIETHILGASNRRKLANYILPTLISADCETFLVEKNGNVMQRMRHITTMQRQVLESNLHDMHKRKLAEKLDDYCVGVIRKNNVLDRLEQSSGSPAEVVENLLKMCAGGCFTDGRAISAARLQAKKHLSKNGFLDSYLASASDAAAKGRMLQNFQQLLVAAGMTDIGAAQS